MTACFFSTRGRGEKCFEDAVIQKILLIWDWDLFKFFIKEITLIQNTSALDWLPIVFLKTRLIPCSFGWLRSVSFPLHLCFPSSSLLQKSLPGTKLAWGDEGIWAVCAKQIIFFLHSVPASIAAGANGQESSPLPWMSEKTSPAMPWPVWAVDALRWSSKERSNHGKNDLLSTPLPGQ